MQFRTTWINRSKKIWRIKMMIAWYIRNCLLQFIDKSWHTLMTSNLFTHILWLKKYAANLFVGSSLIAKDLDLWTHIEDIWSQNLGLKGERVISDCILFWERDSEILHDLAFLLSISIYRTFKEHKFASDEICFEK